MSRKRRRVNRCSTRQSVCALRFVLLCLMCFCSATDDSLQSQEDGCGQGAWFGSTTCCRSVQPSFRSGLRGTRCGSRRGVAVREEGEMSVSYEFQALGCELFVLSDGKAEWASQPFLLCERAWIFSRFCLFGGSGYRLRWLPASVSFCGSAVCAVLPVNLTEKRVRCGSTGRLVF